MMPVGTKLMGELLLCHREERLWSFDFRTPFLYNHYSHQNLLYFYNFLELMYMQIASLKMFIQ